MKNVFRRLLKALISRYRVARKWIQNVQPASYIADLAAKAIPNRRFFQIDSDDKPRILINALKGKTGTRWHPALLSRRNRNRFVGASCDAAYTGTNATANLDPNLPAWDIRRVNHGFAMTILDLAAMSLLGGGASYLAANHASGSFRIPIYKGKDAVWNDWRAAIGGLALISLPFTSGAARHAAGVVAGASALSLASTEAVRYVTVKRAAAQWGAQIPAANVAQKQFGPPAAALPAGSSPANPIPVQKVSGFGPFGMAA